MSKLYILCTMFRESIQRLKLVSTEIYCSEQSRRSTWYLLIGWIQRGFCVNGLMVILIIPLSCPENWFSVWFEAILPWFHNRYCHIEYNCQKYAVEYLMNLLMILLWRWYIWSFLLPNDDKISLKYNMSIRLLRPPPPFATFITSDIFSSH